MWLLCKEASGGVYLVCIGMLASMGDGGIVMTAQMVVLYVVEVCTIRSDVRQYRDTASDDVVFL